MSNFKITWRIGSALFSEKTEELLALFDRQPDVADEIAFIMSDGYDDYALSPLENKQNQVDAFLKVAEKFRSRGISVGFNVWPTFNLYESTLKYHSFPGMVDMNGEEIKSIACPTSVEFIDYMKQKYRIFAKAKPEFIWVDDDCRFTHMEGFYPCFCERCVKGFKNGQFADRESLVNALNLPENRELRIEWSEYGADRLANLCAALRSAVDEIDPEIDLALMTVGATHTTFAGSYIEKCMKAMRSKRGRPGHGFYSDKEPDKLMWKAMEVGRQITEYPDSTTEIFWEEDSHPQNHLNKSNHTRRNEITMALLTGCNGIAFNHQNSYGGIDKRLAREIDELHQNRPRWERYCDFAKGLEWHGAFPYYSWLLTAKADAKSAWLKEDPFGEAPNLSMDITIPENLATHGIALTSNPKNATVTLFSGKTITALTPDEIKNAFSGNVYMDAGALKALEEMGMADLAGVVAEKQILPKRKLIFTNHPFNGEFADFPTNTISPLASVTLIPTDPKVEILGYRSPAIPEEGERCYISKYQNSLGGKVIVNGFDAWYYNDNPHNLYHLNSIFEWFDMPLIIRYNDPYVVSRVAPYIRTNGEKAAVTLVNAAFDTTNPFEILVRGSMKNAVLLNPDGSETPLDVRRENDRLAVKIPKIDIWDIATILLF